MFAVVFSGVLDVRHRLPRVHLTFVIAIAGLLDVHLAGPRDA